ncbi:hypothetical protein SAMN05216574_1272 [Blastococcus tunisiensis]|uniref:Uncharacterized protein n=2 Tax=Blastococcus tunisiensis TaxID=1798228 RepID=A0A1I2LH48_9ACTN|nr:hypothetical protein SAMN05216574_1272 [Blastococcus sp. DSM 46838]
MVPIPEAPTSRAPETAPLHARRSSDTPSVAPPSEIESLPTRIRSLRSGLGQEFHKSPLAFIVAALGLITIAFALVQWLTEDDIRIDSSNVDFTNGQWTSPDMVVPLSLAELNRPPYPGDAAGRAAFEQWAENHDAVYANQMSVSFLARSDKEEPTIIVGARVVVVERREPLGGTWIAPDGAGPAPERVLNADLDPSPPEVMKDPGWEFPLTVTSAEVEAFTVVATTSTCHCLWEIELDVITPDGDNETITVDDEGAPFELTAPSEGVDRVTLPRSEEAWPPR